MYIYRVKNFSKDVADGENYTVLLNQLKPESCSRAPLQERDLLRRAEMILDNAEKINCRKYLTPTALVAGNPKLNLAFVAHLFNTHPGLDPLTEEEAPEIEPFDAEGEREARSKYYMCFGGYRNKKKKKMNEKMGNVCSTLFSFLQKKIVFTLWLNSLNVDPGVYNLFEDLQDGLVLLQAFEKVVPGLVNWRMVGRKQPLSRFKQIENCNYAVALGQELRFSLVGIQGADIVDGQKTLTLGLTWQLMRENIVHTLKSLTKNGRGVSDQDILRWANETVQKGGKQSKASSFKDSSLSTGIFFLDLLNGIKPGYVDYSLVTNGRTEDDAFNNAKLAISIARKLGATIFLVPEDIVEVRPKMVSFFFFFFFFFLFCYYYCK
jgi:plastin-1